MYLVLQESIKIWFVCDLAKTYSEVDLKSSRLQFIYFFNFYVTIKNIRVCLFFCKENVFKNNQYQGTEIFQPIYK